MTGHRSLQQSIRVIDSIPPVHVWPVTPVEVEFYLNASDDAWNDEMTRRYGPDWESIDA